MSAYFGQSFGGFSARQIGNYESGENEIPLELLLAIRAKGYPLEVILGSGSTTLMDETIAYLTRIHRERVVVCQLIEALGYLLQRDRASIERILGGLDLLPQSISNTQQKLLEQLMQLRKEDR